MHLRTLATLSEGSAGSRRGRMQGGCLAMRENVIRRNAARRWVAIVGTALCGAFTLLPLMEVGGTIPSSATTPAANLKTAVCREAAFPAEASVTWFARFRASASSGRGPSIRIVQAGRVSGASSAADGRWVLSWTGPRGANHSARSSASALSRITVRAPMAHLLAPDNNCSLVLSASPTPPGLVAVIGDSVFVNISRDLTAARLPGTIYADRWQISATSGFGWSASAPSWPWTSVKGSWAIGLARGIFAEHPSVLVIELGVNDALRAAFADLNRRVVWAARIRAAVAHNIDQLLTQSADLVPCTVLVTAPDHRTNLIFTGTDYPPEADAVNSLIESAAQRAHSPRIVVADWAAFSGDHHPTPGGAGAWFNPGDEVHPTPAGEGALLSLIEQTVQTCPSGPR